MTDPIIPDQHKELAARIESALSQIRPYLEADQGDITLKEITDDLIVKVELLNLQSRISIGSSIF